jgi:hypothetical protein
MRLRRLVSSCEPVAVEGRRIGLVERRARAITLDKVEIGSAHRPIGSTSARPDFRSSSSVSSVRLDCKKGRRFDHRERISCARFSLPMHQVKISRLELVELGDEMAIEISALVPLTSLPPEPMARCEIPFAARQSRSRQPWPPRGQADPVLDRSAHLDDKPMIALPPCCAWAPLGRPSLVLRRVSWAS